MNKQILTFVFAFALSVGVVKAEYIYNSTLLDLGDTLGGVVQGSDGAWQNSPHGVVVAPDGNVWVNIYGGYGRMEILASGDTVHYKGIYVLDPATGAHVSFSPIEILAFPDGTSDSLTAESANSGGGRGIEIDADGNILSSHYKTLYKINYMTGEGMAMWEGESSLTEAVADANGNVFVSYVLAGERPCVVLDGDLNYVGNAIDTVGHINRAIEVTADGEDMYFGSTWNGHGVTHWNSTVPGVLAHEFVDTFAVGYDIDACWDEIGSAMGADSAFIGWCDEDTTFAETALWASSLDFSPDGDLLVGALTAGWGGPLGGVYWLFDMEDTDEPIAIVGNWHDWEGTGEGVTDGPRGAAWDADGNVYLADFYSNGVYHYAADFSSVSSGPKSIVASEYVLKQNYPNPFNPNTKIEFKVPANEHVSINVYNLEGRLVKTLINQNMMSGQHVVEWNGTNQFGAKVASGMYIYQLKTNATVLNRTMTFIK